jgi:hypothetical protein
MILLSKIFTVKKVTLFSLFAILIFISSCKSNTSQSKLIKENNGIKPEDCPISQVNQTDEFLKNINELKDYKWNDVTKQATLVLNDDEKLIITRGGCIHFMVEATFYPTEKINIAHDNYQSIFNKLLWITNLLEDFKYNKLKNAIENEEYTQIKNQHVTTLIFDNTVLKEKFYAITINLKSNTFSISQYLE